METIIRDIMRREGGFVNDPSDPGGPTKYGITLKSFTEYCNAIGTEVTPTVEDLRQLSSDDAVKFYKWYFHVHGIDRIQHFPLKALMADICVNHGPGRAYEWLRDACLLPLAASKSDIIKAADSKPMNTYYTVLRYRTTFYGRIISHNQRAARFAYGWLRRLAEFIQPLEA